MMSILSTRHVLFLYTCLKIWHHACARTDAISDGGGEIATTDNNQPTSSSIIGSPYACAECCKGKNDLCSGMFYVTRCYCDEACIDYGDCCYNYIPMCGNPADAERDDVWCSSLGVCCHGQNNWCAGTVAGLTCYCDEACDGLGDCCDDYKFYCKGYMSYLWYADASRWTAPTQDTTHTTAMPTTAPTTTVGEIAASTTDGNSEGSDNDMQASICNRDVSCCESLDIALCEGVIADGTSCYCDPSCPVFQDCCVGVENCMHTDVIEE